MGHLTPPLEGPYRPRVGPRSRFLFRPLVTASLLVSASALFATAWALL